MIASIEGKLIRKTENTVTISTASGLGFEVFVPYSVISTISGIGSTVFLHTYLQVKEDGVSLFGFQTAEELAVFKLLITVNGIGPKGAIGILSGISVDDLRFAVLAEDTKTISKIPGIGAKTAGKLILELKDKFNLEDALEAKLVRSNEQTKDSGIREEAAQALAALGYSATEAAKVLRGIELTEQTTVEELIKQGLKRL